MIEDKGLGCLAVLFVLLGLAWFGFVVWVLATVVEWLVTK